MAKNFDRAASSKKFTEIARASSEKANFITIKMLRNERLFDYPSNFEDTGDTVDLENSIKELGFTDPIEVTAFGMSEGDYMIVSGHRRRVAGVKVGLDVFPCIVKAFDSEDSLKNYVMLSNSQRDSSKDPLLYCRRYKMHEEYLKSIGFKGGLREEIAKRLGISPQQADRYNQFNRIISPVWDMVRDDLVGMSSVLQMAVHDVGQQEEILKIFYECVDAGIPLTRDTCDKVIKSYRADKRELSGILKRSVDKVDKGESVEKDTGRGKEAKSGRLINRHLAGLTKCLGGNCAFESAQEAEEAIKSFRLAFGDIIDGIYAMGKSYDKVDLFQELLETVSESLSKYRER